ncbi:BgtE-5604 [Blumeria graminis f. sp. tritici]|uniref:BgtE-5604 n=2 Tax=Blumeria graminis f. sp. tritici TaxID=62690 RepID=A0A061HGJ9_BLUGR|nr:putative secreted effector protein [Blumeria graminis f. sp. tritici 96224]VDB94997.1 BgtE-5604 [Blumeria graminis f. sp. tritici]
MQLYIFFLFFGLCFASLKWDDMNPFNRQQRSAKASSSLKAPELRNLPLYTDDFGKYKFPKNGIKCGKLHINEMNANIARFAGCEEAFKKRRVKLGDAIQLGSFFHPYRITNILKRRHYMYPIGSVMYDEKKNIQPTPYILINYRCEKYAIYLRTGANMRLLTTNRKPTSARSAGEDAQACLNSS